MASLIIFMGATGAGKSTQADLLVARKGWIHISSGRLLRESSEYKAVLESGRLAPSSAVEGLVDKALSKIKPSDTVILDGFPRTIEDVNWLEAFVNASGIILQGVVLLNVNRPTSMKRLGSRHRSDDSVPALEEKWREFDQETSPVLNYYLDQGILMKVDANGTIGEVYTRIKEVLKL